MQKNLQAIVLAAGKSSRFNTKTSKLLHKICGQEMILYITKLLSNLSIPTSLIVGYQKELLQEVVNNHHKDVNFIEQKEQLGTGHAVLCSQDIWKEDHILILNGDMPLINEQIINSLYYQHASQGNTVTFVTAPNNDPSNAYGKVVHEGNKIRIIEAKDDTREKKENNLINAGIYLIKRDFLQAAITQLQKSKVTGEFYITDLIHMASDTGKKVQTLNVPLDLVRGINTLHELWAAEQLKKAELIKNFMNKGVRFAAAQTNHIDINVKIESDTFIGANVELYGNTTIGQECKIESFCIITNSQLENNVHVKSHSVVQDSVIKINSSVGPFAHVQLQQNHFNFADSNKKQNNINL